MSKKAMRRSPTSRNERRKAIARKLDVASIDADAWMRWCDAHLSPREAELMHLADKADRAAD